MDIFDSSVAVITGSSRGVGFAVAQALVAHGVAVVVNGRDPDAVAGAVRALSNDGARVAGVAGTASEPVVVQRMVDEASRFGDIDVLVNCAGTAEPPGSSIVDIDDEAWSQLIDSHLHATFATCRAVAPLMAARKRGSIVNTSSHAFTGVFGGTGYAAGKGAVNSLTMAMAAELREHGVRVNAVCPGARTRLSTGEEYEHGIEELHRRGILDDLTRMGALAPPPPEHVAELYAFLASDLAADVTGQILVGAGGYLGKFPKPEEQMITYRDHNENPPYTVHEIANLVKKLAAET